MRQPLVAFPPNIKLPYALLKGRGVEGWPCLGQLFDHHGFPDAGSSQPAVQPWASGGGSEAGDIITQLHRSWQRSWPLLLLAC